MKEDHQIRLLAEIQAARDLTAKGWIPQGAWRFISPSGTFHDLSAADLTQLDRIEKEGLFIIKEE